VAILFLLGFLTQAETIGFAELSELANARRQNPSRGSASGVAIVAQAILPALFLLTL
jgi:hypothetical protein